MKARDVMMSPVVTVTPRTSVREVAQLFLDKRISGAPVLGDDGKLVGIVSEGDLLHRAEAGTGRRRSWWLGSSRKTPRWPGTMSASMAKALPR
jgi:predicted transcriptional regulator